MPDVCVPQEPLLLWLLVNMLSKESLMPLCDAHIALEIPAAPVRGLQVAPRTPASLLCDVSVAQGTLSSVVCVSPARKVEHLQLHVPTLYDKTQSQVLRRTLFCLVSKTFMSYRIND